MQTGQHEPGVAVAMSLGSQSSGGHFWVRHSTSRPIHRHSVQSSTRHLSPTCAGTFNTLCKSVISHSLSHICLSDKFLQKMNKKIMPSQKYCLKIIFLWKYLLIFTVYRINTSICLDHVLLCTSSPPFFYLVNGPLILTRYRGQVLTPGAAFPRGLDESLLLFTHYCFTSNHTTKHIPSLKQIKDMHQKLMVNFTVYSDIFFGGGGFNCFFF